MVLAQHKFLKENNQKQWTLMSKQRCMRNNMIKNKMNISKERNLCKSKLLTKKLRVLNLK